MNTVLYIVSPIGGLGLAVQEELNSTMRQSTGSAAFAALVSFSVGLIALAFFAVVTRGPLPTRAAFATAPAWVWAWLGGVFGAFYVAMATIAVARFGATTLLVLVARPSDRFADPRSLRLAWIRTTFEALLLLFHSPLPNVGCWRRKASLFRILYRGEKNETVV
jgi:uncharacterized membrane protein YdcZ (DUF606 family)